MDRPVFAHSVQDAPESAWETLEAHALAAARGASAFGAAFDAGAWAFNAGLLHDFGKAKPEFQLYLRGKRPRGVTHSGEGARFVWARWGAGGRILAHIIAGHHAGLPDTLDGHGGRPLSNRMDATPLLDPPDWMARALRPVAAPPALADGRVGDPFVVQFFTRMLFSTLVDADRQETGRFYGALPEDPWAAPEEDWRAAVFGGFEAGLAAQMQALAARPAGDRDVAAMRAALMAAARSAAPAAQGLFSMTAPTGSGKTLASLAFALDHARAHGLRRIVYVAPFTAIVEQTAQVFRDALGRDDAVLEHHSNFEPTAPDGGALDEDERRAARAIAQRWTAPVVVTTSVQFFESLFSSHPGRCRKLHRLARSVVILDEFQALPVGFLRPCLRALSALAQGYGTSVLLCTATMPRVFDGQFQAPEGLKGVREIVPDPQAMATTLERVRVERAGAVSDDQLAKAFAQAPQMIAVVNNRRHARELFGAIKTQEGACHLSTAMTPGHRKAALEEIGARLAAGEPCRLATTSVIEAGVDLDAPEVWRALAGLDQMKQAAGRCNREGRLGPRGGRFVIFEAADKNHAPPRQLERFAQVARVVLDAQDDPFNLAAMDAYFDELYWNQDESGLDSAIVGSGQGKSAGILKAIGVKHGERVEIPFASVSAAFRLIDEQGAPVIIPKSISKYGAPKEVLDRLRFAPHVGGVAAELQRYVVNVPRKPRQTLLDVGSAERIRETEFADRFVLLTQPGLYTEDSGLDWSDPLFRTAESNIIETPDKAG